MNLGAPEGTKDILPPQAEIANPEEKWRDTALFQKLEGVARDAFRRFGYEEIRTPLFEYTALFHKTSGETSDIVQKEMFTFGDPEDQKGTYSLRPELTPGTIRAAIDEGLFAKRSTWKLWYFGPAFRKERPQKGRFRQFHQLGVEAMGASDPLLDAETMILFADILGGIGVKAWKLRINSIGCASCRPAYREKLKDAVRSDLASYCEDCRKRFERNVFRIFDCKVQADIAKAAKLPTAIEHACDACKAHMKGVELALRAAEVPYRVDPRIVRGLDYYTRTVYEFTSSKLGSQDAVAGGGRYDTLVKDMGGPDVGSVGFAAGVERILLAMEGQGTSTPSDFFAVAVTEAERPAVFQAVTTLRRAGLSGDMDYEGRSLKAQMRSANRSGARFALLIGPDEVANKVVTLKDMAGHGEKKLSLEEARAALKGGTP
jgi:histidyl-tRNA synthetase